MICQVCNERSAAFERGNGAHRLRMCFPCLSRTGMHLLEGWRILPVGRIPDPCPGCGQTWEAFAIGGRYGCPSCAASFADTLRTLTRAPSEAPPGREAGMLPAQTGSDDADLSLALLLEDYELAAQIRDRMEQESARWRS